MKTVTELFDKQFMLTGTNADPKGLDFLSITHALITSNPDGTPAVIDDYMSYDSRSGTYSDLAVERKYEYTFNGPMMTQRIETTNWYFDDGSTIGTSLQLFQNFQ
jgi:hypothetical protein